MPHFRLGAAHRAIALGALFGIALPVLAPHPSAAQQRNGGGNGNRGGNNGVVRGNGNGTGNGAAGAGGGTASGGGGGTGGGGGGTGGGTANGGTGGSGNDASCMPGPGPADCQDRCPSFDTCTVLSSSGQLDHLYFQLEDQQFQCNGLDCESAAQSLDDYCCQRGEFAPSKDAGGCTLPEGASGTLRGEGGSATSHALLGVSGALLAGMLILRRRTALK